MFREALTNWLLKSKTRRQMMVWLVDSQDVVWPAPKREYWQLADEGYTSCAEVYACINMLARTCKGIKWVLYNKQKAGKKLIEIEGEHPLYTLLTKANPYQSWAKFMENLIGYYKVSGNSYIYRVGPDKKSPPKELWLLRPDRVTVIPGKTAAVGPVAGYKYVIKENEPVDLMPDRVLESEPWQVVMHMKTFNPMDDQYGLSPIRAGARVVDQINEAAKLNYALLKNGMRTSGAFVYKGAFDERLEADLKRQVTEQYSGSSNAGKQLLLSGDLDWKEMGITPKDMDWMEGQKMDTRRICSIFGVAPELIGDVQNKTYNNQKEARRALYVEAVMPLLDDIQDQFNAWLCPLFDGGTGQLQMRYDQDDIEAIKDERNAVWVNVLNAVNSGVITPNEGRHTLGYETMENDPKADQLRDPTAKAVDGPSRNNPSVLPPTKNDDDVFPPVVAPSRRIPAPNGHIS